MLHALAHTQFLLERLRKHVQCRRRALDLRKEMKGAGFLNATPVLRQRCPADHASPLQCVLDEARDPRSELERHLLRDEVALQVSLDGLKTELSGGELLATRT